MSSLTTGDVRRILDFLLELHIPCNLESLSTQVVKALPEVIPALEALCSQVNFSSYRVFAYYTSRSNKPLGEMEQIAHHHFNEHVLVTHYFQTGDGKAYKISDFLTESELHRLEGLYQKALRPRGIEDSLALFLGDPYSTSMSSIHNQGDIQVVSLHRDKRDFSERDRLVFNLLSPHLFQAYQNATALTQLQQQLNQFNRTMEQLSIIVLNAEGTVK